MPNIWIKICGITRPQDAVSAAELGANAIGLVFYPASPRAVSIEQVAVILQGLPEQLLVFALLVNPDVSAVRAIVDSGQFDYLQFHGAESAEFCESFGLPYMKAIRVSAELDLNAELAAHETADLILFDSFGENAPGGTGKTFDWSLATRLAQSTREKLVLAGGLNAANVKLAIHQVQPFGVDVSSGVEQCPGIKDRAKIKAFIEGARSVGH